MQTACREDYPNFYPLSLIHQLPSNTTIQIIHAFLINLLKVEQFSTLIS